MDRYVRAVTMVGVTLARCVVMGTLLILTGSWAAGSDEAKRPSSQVLPGTQGNLEDSIAAVPTMGTGELYAFLVGVSQYRDHRIPQLRSAAKDARDVAAFLATQKELFQNVRVTVLTNEQATKGAIEKYLLYDLRKAGRFDTVILFFSGHGAIDVKRPGEFFFLTYEADPDFLGISAVNMTGLSFLKELDCPRVVMIADACHAGGFSRLAAKAAVISLEKFVQEFTASSGRVIITSSRPGEYSLEDPRLENGVFTHHLLEGLKGAADKDGHGFVTVNEAYAYVYERTKWETEGAQHPQFEGTVEGIFPLALSASLASRPPTILELMTNPASADVYVGGRFVGKTNPDGSLCLKYLPLGKEIPVTVAKGGWKKETVGFTFTSERMLIKPDPVRLRPMLAALEIKTVPGEVKVTIDGRAVGKTNRNGRLLVHGIQVALSHDLALERPGFQDESALLTIPEDFENKEYSAGTFRLTREGTSSNAPTQPTAERPRSSVPEDRAVPRGTDWGPGSSDPGGTRSTKTDRGSPNGVQDSNPATRYLHFDHQ